jgi:hypothetical protein
MAILHQPVVNVPVDAGGHQHLWVKIVEDERRSSERDATVLQLDDPALFANS